MAHPRKILNWIDGNQNESSSGQWFDKLSPHDGTLIANCARSNQDDINQAVNAAKKAQKGWAEIPAVSRGMILHEIVRKMQDNQKEIAEIVALETGKSYKDAFGETGGAIALGLFYASEGQRLYGKTTTSGAPNKHVQIVRQPIGVAGLIIAANTPIANVAWKVFPALLCGNGVVLKCAEDTPATAWIVGKIAAETNLPAGILNIVQGYGEEAGQPLVEHPDVGVISFTGSTAVGRQIAVSAGRRLARLSLELGGKNPLVVCDDADLGNAVRWVLLSAFSNAGQRCAAASRIIVFDSIYEHFVEMLVDATQKLKIGPTDQDDFGPVINENQLNNMLAIIERARKSGARMLTGGNRLTDAAHQNGFYIAPTLIDGVGPEDEISQTELFGPVACLYRVKDFQAALEMANHSAYGLTASIHTRNIHRATVFTQKVQAGTYGSEPHMPFGGFKQSGNGSREPGTEALDVYSETKTIYTIIDPQQC